MLSFPPAVRIWMATTPADMRKSFDALAELVRQHLHNDPLSGHVFVFRNKRSDRVKLLYWDEDGFVIVYKRLEEGAFHFPEAPADGNGGVTMRAADLLMLLDGVDWQNVKRSKRYRRPAATPA
jgi:transposase